jgi:hypothetical protein
MNRTLVSLFAISILALTLPLGGHARQGGNLGLGIVAGNPSGVSSRLWVGNRNSIDFIAGFDLYHDRVSINADYVWHEFGLFPVRRGQLPLYYGMGLWTSVSNDPAMGARGKVGIAYLFPNAPLDAFFELGPSAAILPSTGFGLDAGLGMRFFF